MKYLTYFILFCFITSIFNSCQMRSTGSKASGSGTDGKNGTDGNDGVDSGDGDDGLDGVKDELSDLEYLSCMLYQEQKKKDEWFESHNLYNSCGYVETEIEGETIYETVEECTNQYSDTSSEASTCANYGDPAASTYTELSISIKIKLLQRAMVVIQNGMISILPWYGWYTKAPDSSFWQTFWDVAGSIPASGNVYSSLTQRHFTGALPGEGTDCSGEDAGSLQPQQAVVTVNGNSYNWYWTGFAPFKILEFQDQYSFSTDCAITNQKTDDDTDTYIDVKASAFNNLTYPIHFIQVENKTFKGVHNIGCREVTVNFTLGYYKAISSEYESYNYDYSELEEMCKDVTATE